MLTRLLGAVVGLAVAGMVTAAQAGEAQYQKRYCAGMKQEVTMPSGARADCISADYAIEVDMSPKWAEAIGQSLLYAAESNRKPGIVLICEDTVNCNSHANRLVTAVQGHQIPVTVWFCMPEDATLDDCAVDLFEGAK